MKIYFSIHSFLSALLMLISLNSNAQSLAFGDWVFDDSTTSKGYIAAYTMNGSYSLLGKVCYLSNNMCHWSLALDVSCIKNSSSPVLLNLSSEGIHTEVYCDGTHNQQLYTYLFKDHDLMGSAFSKAQMVGIAFALTNEQFKVLRFSLYGSTEAINAMYSQLQKYSQEGNRTV
ncbi:MAG: hypothetical protein RL637_737, partial [Pseudomonadota bacterium]